VSVFDMVSEARRTCCAPFQYKPHYGKDLLTWFLAVFGRKVVFLSV
jgi:hypothetical protein